MANIIPMAGLGSRFADVGYTLPKPLIPASGIPMIIKAIRDMPKSDKWVFMVRKEHIEEYHVDKVIKCELPNAIIVPVEKTTEGQACTCMLALPYLKPEEPLFIAACDNGYVYNEKEYKKLCDDKNVDCVVWTFTQRETLRRNPTAWGWYKLENDKKTIQDISIKVPVSNDPYNDHAVVATFFFKKVKDFVDATNLMMKENFRVKNEFYVDCLPKFLKKLNKKSVIFDVDLYLGWGTPADLYDYQKMEYVCKYGVLPKNVTEEEKRLLPVWKRYFEKE